VCYNNIANFQYKNEKYGLAAENYWSAALIADICLGTLDPREFYKHRLEWDRE